MKTSIKKDHLHVISLFCGAGGLDRGFRAAGFKTAIAFDSDPAAVRTYNFNAKRKTAIEADLSSLKPEEIIEGLSGTGCTVRPCGIVGGPPCQGFSRGNVYSHPDDPRNHLPFRYAEILAALNARYELDFFVFENVTGLSGPKHTVRFNEVKQAFRDAGFNVFEKELDSALFGVPQRRHRLFVVGLNAGLYTDTTFKFPTGGDVRHTVRDAISGLPAATLYARGLSSKNIAYHPNHWTMRPKSKKFSQGLPLTGRSFKRLDWDEPSPTVAYGNREIHVHPEGRRRLTVLEAMLLQGFAGTYRLLGNLSEQVTQVSNAVPPPVAQAVAENIMTLIRERRRKNLSL